MKGSEYGPTLLPQKMAQSDRHTESWEMQTFLFVEIGSVSLVALRPANSDFSSGAVAHIYVFLATTLSLLSFFSPLSFL